MKKIITLSIIAMFAFVVNVDAQRFGTTPSKDNTGRVLTYGYLTPAYSATIATTPAIDGKYKTVIKPATLTGAATVTIVDTYSRVCDELIYIFTADGSGRVVTFTTNFIPNGTLSVAASKQATVYFIYDGTNYVEVARTLQP